MQTSLAKAPTERVFDVAVIVATSTGVVTAAGLIDSSRWTWLHHGMYAACVATWCAFAVQRRETRAVAPSGLLLTALPFMSGRRVPHRVVGMLLAAEGTARRHRGDRWS